MKRTFHHLRKRGKSALCVLLAAVLVTSVLSAAGLPITARGAERVFDIGVNAESVTATLSEDGVLTVSGSGAIRDFTPETAPFANVSVVSLVLGKDVTAIGSYTFYNCGELTGELELPAGLVRIGERAFSGASGAQAPRLTFVKNPFTEQRVTRKREDVAAATPAPPAAPASAAPSAAAPAAEEEASPEAAESEAAPEEETPLPEESAAGEPAEQAAGAASSESEDEAVESGSESTPAPTEAPAPTQAPEDGNRFVIETVTQQEIGEEIFYPRKDSPAFTCSSENHSFRAAMKAAGYVEADRLLTAAFDCGEGTAEEETVVTRDLPVVDGQLLLPGLLPEFSGPADQGLYTYRFSGWTESQDAPDQVRAPGSAYPAGDREDLYFIAGWDRQVRLKIDVRWEGSDVLLSVPEVEGYALTGFRWQSAYPNEGQEVSGDPELLAWEDIPEAEDASYRVENPAEDDARLFRCLVTARKEVSFLKRLFSAPARGEEISLSAVRIRKAAAAVDGFVVLDPNGGTVPSGAVTQLAVQGDGSAAAPECAFTAPSGDVVFCGWTDGANHYDPGDVVSGGTVLQAKWKEPVLTATVTTAEELLAQMAGAQAPEVAEEALYLNVITLSGTVSLASGQTELPSAENACACTVTGGVLESAEPVALQMDARFAGVTLSVPELAARGHRCVLGSGTEMTGTLYGGDGSAGGDILNRNTDLRVFSGNLTAMYGGGKTGGILADAGPSDSGYASVFLGGNAQAGNVYGGGEDAVSAVSRGTSVTVAQDAAVSGNVYGGGSAGTVASAQVTLRGGTVAGSVYGGGRQGAVDDDAQVLLLGTANDVYGGGEQSGGTVAGDASVTVTGGSAGNLYGGGNRGQVSGDATVTVEEGARVSGDVYGGGADGAVTGSTSVELADSTVRGSVYGGGESGSVENGSATVTLTGGASVLGSVYGGGRNGSATVEETSVTLTDGILEGSIFAGGAGGPVTRAATVTVTGGEVQGRVFGGGETAPVGVGTDPEAADASTAAQTTVLIRGGTVGSVYGGGADGAVFGHTTVTLSGGGVENDVFGGGSRAHVTGRTQVEIKGTAQVGGGVYGGGNLGGSAGNEYTGQVLVHGGSSVTWDGQSGAAVSGSLTGGGSLTEVEPAADRTLTLKNLNGVTLAAIQRAAAVEIVDSAVTLTGGRDAGGDRAERSLSQIGALTLTRSTLSLEAGARDLRALANGDETEPGTLRLLSGLTLRVADVTGSAAVYGPVTGTLRLERISGENAGDEGGVRVQAALDSTGDLTAAALTSGQVAGAYRYWQLGDPLTRLSVTLTASHEKAGGFRTDAPSSQELNLNGVGSTLRVVSVERVSGSFRLVQPTLTDGEMTDFTLPQGGTAEDTYALRVTPAGDNWSGSGGVTLLVDGEGTASASGEFPVPVGSGDAALQCSLLYDASGKFFEGGVLRVTLEETADGESLGTTVLELTVAGDENISSQSSAITAGRRFTDALTGDGAEITAKGAVTALFTSRFFPSGVGALGLYTVEDGQPVEAEFPAGTRLILSDVSGDVYRYYYYACDGAARAISLALPWNPGSGGKNYAGFAEEGIMASERLLFVVDFSGTAGLSAGTYYLALTHRDDEDWDDLAPAAFTVSGEGQYRLALEKSSDTTGQVWRMAVTAAVPDKDTRYADGASVQFSLTRKAAQAGESDTAVPFPDNVQVEINGEESGVLRDRGGTIYCALPVGSASAGVTFRFINVPASAFADGAFELSAVMTPRVGLQIGSDGAGSGVEGVSSNTLAFELAREAAAAPRSVSVTMASDGQRLVDASQEAQQLAFSLAYTAQEGDTLSAEILVKTKTDSPAPDSYSPVDNAAQWTAVLPASLGTGEGSGTLTVTVPQGQAAGTYRILVRILDSEGNRVAEEPYNIIVQ